MASTAALKEAVVVWSLNLILNSDQELKVITLALTSLLVMSKDAANVFKKYFSSLYLSFSEPDESRMNPMSAEFAAQGTEIWK